MSHYFKKMKKTRLVAGGPTSFWATPSCPKTISPQIPPYIRATPLGVMEKTSLDELPSNLGSARSSPSRVKTTGGRPASAATASDQVSARTIVTVSVVLGAFLVASVTFVWTEARCASRSHVQLAPNGPCRHSGRMARESPTGHRLLLLYHQPQRHLLPLRYPAEVLGMEAEWPPSAGQHS